MIKWKWSNEGCFSLEYKDHFISIRPLDEVIGAFIYKKTNTEECIHFFLVCSDKRKSRNDPNAVYLPDNLDRFEFAKRESLKYIDNKEN